MGLETVYERSGEHARDQRILGEVLEVAPAQRGALDVDPGAEHDVNPLRPSLDGDRLAHPAHELGVEGRRKRRCGGEARGRRAARDPVVLAILRLPTQPMRAVGHGDRRDAQSRHRQPCARSRSPGTALPSPPASARSAVLRPPRERVRAGDAAELHGAVLRHGRDAAGGRAVLPDDRAVHRDRSRAAEQRDRDRCPTCRPARPSSA